MKTIEWCSGLFEGEGCITRVGTTGRWHVEIEMSDKDVIETWHKTMGLTTKITERPSRNGRKVTYLSQTRKKSEVRRILSAMLPHLGNRRAHKALDCLDELENV